MACLGRDAHLVVGTAIKSKRLISSPLTYCYNKCLVSSNKYEGLHNLQTIRINEPLSQHYLFFVPIAGMENHGRINGSQYPNL